MKISERAPLTEYVSAKTFCSTLLRSTITRKPFRIPWMVVSLGMSLFMLASAVDAIMLESGNMRTDQTGLDERLNLRKPSSRLLADIHLAANDQTVEHTRPKRQVTAAENPKKQEPAAENQKKQEATAEDHPEEDSKSASPVGVAPETEEEAYPRVVFSRIIDLPGAGVLTPKGALVVEPYLSFAHLTTNRVTLTGFTIVPTLTIGLINVQGVSRNIYTTALVGRYGLTNRLELELRIPYLYRDDTYTLRPLAVASTRDTVEEFTGSGLGDIETTARYQINKGGADDPYFVGFLRFKSTTGKGPFDVPINPSTGFQEELPTGSGFYILQPGLTVLYPSDPAVLFGSMSFIWNMPRNVGGQIGTVEPGNGANANIGLGISLNEKLTLSLGYDHTVFARPTSSSNLLLTTAPTNTHVGVLLVGGGYRLSDRSFMSFVVGVGVTREAPDLQLTLRIPTAFFLKQ